MLTSWVTYLLMKNSTYKVSSWIFCWHKILFFRNSQSLKGRKESNTFDKYLSTREVKAGLAANVLIKGSIRINQKNYKDAYINSPVSLPIHWLNTGLSVTACSDLYQKTQVSVWVIVYIYIVYYTFIHSTFLILFHECSVHHSEAENEIMLWRHKFWEELVSSYIPLIWHGLHRKLKNWGGGNTDIETARWSHKPKKLEREIRRQMDRHSQICRQTESDIISFLLFFHNKLSRLKLKACGK